MTKDELFLAHGRVKGGDTALEALVIQLTSLDFWCQLLDLFSKHGTNLDELMQELESHLISPIQQPFCCYKSYI